MGLEQENLVILGGQNKAGKTTLAVNTVDEALVAGLRVLVVTTEISAVQYVLRLASKRERLSLRDIRANDLNPRQRMALDSALRGKIAHADLEILDKPNATVQEVIRHAQEHIPDILVIDHLQRLNLLNNNMALGIKEGCLELKNLAIRASIPILLLSQTQHGEGWYEKTDDDQIQYRLSNMSTRWGREPLGEGDKILFFHNLAREFPEEKYIDRANLIVHSQRDYESGDIIPVRIHLAHQWVGDEHEYRERYDRNNSGNHSHRGSVGGRADLNHPTGTNSPAADDVSAQQKLPSRVPSGGQGERTLGAAGVLGL